MIPHSLALALCHRAALADLGWECGPVELHDGRPGFRVIVPARPPMRGRKGHGSEEQVRTFGDDGELTVAHAPIARPGAVRP